LSSQPQRSPSPIQLEPFVHQVGGHFPIVCLDGTTVCKPLNDREHKFYQTMPDVLKPFAPSFEGTMKVETAEDEEGYIMLRGQPPPNYSRANAWGSNAKGKAWRRSYKRQHSSLQYRLKRKESIEIVESLVRGQEPEEGEQENFVVSASAPARAQSVPPSPPEDSFYNPWALKCHRDHLKKLGMLRPPSSLNLLAAAAANCSGGEATSSEEETSTSKRKKKSTSSSASSSTSRTNPQMYLLLENLVWRHRRPCVLDLKVGSRQHADDSSASKKQRKIAKAAATTSGTLGLRVCGMQVYCVATGRYACHNKYYGRSLDDSGFKSAIVEYLTGGGGGGDLRIDVLDRLMERLSELKGVLCELDTFRFYTSSLLITYDGGNGCNNAGSVGHQHHEDDDEECDIVDLRIIDFAHSTHEGMRDATLHVGPDGGFVFGLNNFIEILGDIKAHNGVLDFGGGDDADDIGTKQKSAIPSL